MPTKFKGDWTPKSSNGAESALVDCLAKAMTQAMEFAVDVAVDTVETSGTDREWAGPWYGRTGTGKGRVNTGEMRDSLDSDVEKQSHKVIGRAGWLEGSPFYYLYQEYGFEHWITGEMIPGMHALREADQQAWDEFMSLADACIVRFKNAV